jgi:putative tryptophan/tyrosine transport system substrate-binding protein
MRRREFIALIGGGLVAWPLAARSQSRLKTIGFLGPASPSAWSQWTSAFVARLRELGWMEGRTVAIEYRWAEGRSERFAEIAREFVHRNVDVIVTSGTAVQAIKQVTSTIPIVFAVAVDPVGGGLVSSLARPGGNATGFSIQAPDAVGKRLELLREILPGLKRIAVLANVGYPAAALEATRVEQVARALGMDVTKLEIRRVEDIAAAFAMLRPGVDALYVVVEPLVITNAVRINTLSLAARLPSVCGTREYVTSGGLLAYGPNFPDLFQRAGDYVDKILRGAKPADLPIQQPTKFDLIINVITAKALGIDIPPTLLARADEVIE